MRRKGFCEDAIHFAPFVLLPSPFPRDEFQKAVKLQPILNRLMSQVANDTKFLSETLKATIKVDNFTKRLHDIMVEVNREGVAQVTFRKSFNKKFLLVM